MLKLIYTVFLGVILAIFVGVGVSVFYPEPEYPEAPDIVKYGPYENRTPVQNAQEEAYNRKVATFEEDEMQPYNRNVSIIATVVAVLFLVVGVMYSQKLDVVADGMLLGGIFTLLYGMGRGIASQDEVFRFIVVVVGVAVALGLGYWKFAKPNISPAPSPAKKE